MKVTPRSLSIYKTADGKEPFRQWMKSLSDQMTVARIRARLNRLRDGNLGDAKSVGSGVMELRFTFGSGVRIYFGQAGEEIIVLLIGGDKSTQSADIKLAQEQWADYLRREKNG
jgi:putative addiction module killer protein